MDIKKYIYGHCVTPVRIKTFDAYSNTFIFRDVPCGKCLHCRNTHVNEWVTRMYAQAQYSQNVYFVSLDYKPFNLTSPVAKQLAAETAACYHDINLYHTKAMHPLVLCKNHLQDFFKRLRRNTSKKLSYFACGEYGTHAGGKGFGRPHFHVILFSNDSFTQDDFDRAWTIHGYSIGRVDVQPLRLDGLYLSKLDSSQTSKFCFRYVCKYLQKDDFDFEKLSTIHFHRTYFRSLKLALKQEDLFQSSYVENSTNVDYTWDDYCKDYSPFTCCSKRESIGSGYLNDNLERFSKGDFRLFGLPNECPAVFPRYFIKKTKEFLCPFMAIGETSDKESSNARITNISAVLREIYNSRLDFSLFNSSSDSLWHPGKYFGEPCLYKYKADVKNTVNPHILFKSLHMYDYSNNLFYQFVGYGYYTWTKVRGVGYLKQDYLDIIDVLNKIDPYLDRLRNSVLEPFYYNKILTENDLHCSIVRMFGSASDSYSKFKEYVYSIYDTELSIHKEHKMLSNNSKLSF